MSWAQCHCGRVDAFLDAVTMAVLVFVSGKAESVSTSTVSSTYCGPPVSRTVPGLQEKTQTHQTCDFTGNFHKDYRRVIPVHLKLKQPGLGEGEESCPGRGCPGGRRRAGTGGQSLPTGWNRFHKPPTLSGVSQNFSET